MKQTIMALVAAAGLVALSGCAATEYTEFYEVEVVSGGECTPLNGQFSNCPPLTVKYNDELYTLPIYTWSEVGEKTAIRCTPDMRCRDHTYQID